MFNLCIIGSCSFELSRLPDKLIDITQHGVKYTSHCSYIWLLWLSPSLGSAGGRGDRSRYLNAMTPSMQQAQHCLRAQRMLRSEITVHMSASGKTSNANLKLTRQELPRYFYTTDAVCTNLTSLDVTRRNGHKPEGWFSCACMCCRTGHLKVILRVLYMRVLCVWVCATSCFHCVCFR